VTGVQLGGSLAGKLASEVSSTTSRFFPRGVVLAAGDSKLPTLDDIEREHVERVMAASGGRKTDAARTLGVSRPRLDRLLAKYGLS